MLRAGDLDGAVMKAVQLVATEALLPGQPPLKYREQEATSLAEMIFGGAVLLFLLVFLIQLARIIYIFRRRQAFLRRLNTLQRARDAFARRTADEGYDGCLPPCAICLDEMPAGLSFEDSATHLGAELLRCGHCFHQHCMAQWARSSRSAGIPCPLCRSTGARIGDDMDISSSPGPSGVRSRHIGATANARRPLSSYANDVWRYSLDNLARDYSDVPGVERWSESCDEHEGGWVNRFRASEELERSIRQAASETTSTHGASAVSWGGGSCDGGGGAGGSW